MFWWLEVPIFYFNTLLPMPVTFILFYLHPIFPLYQKTVVVQDCYERCVMLLWCGVKMLKDLNFCAICKDFIFK